METAYDQHNAAWHLTIHLHGGYKNPIRKKPSSFLIPLKKESRYQSFDSTVKQTIKFFIKLIGPILLKNMMGLNLNASSKPRKMRSEAISIGPVGLVYLVIAISYEKGVFNLFSFVAPKSLLHVSQWRCGP